MWGEGLGLHAHCLDVARVLALDEARQVLLYHVASGLAWLGLGLR